MKKKPASVEIIIPFYNEAHRLAETVRGLSTQFGSSEATALGVQTRIWWADDGSTDGSAEKLKEFLKQYPNSALKHEVLRRDQNQGKGSIMRHAIDTLRGVANPSSLIGFWDSDGELHPQGLIDAISAFINREADIVFGSRFSKLNPQVLNFRHYIGNKLLTLLSNYFSNLNLSDVHCCARFMSAELLFQLPLKSKGFEFEAELAGLVGRIRRPNLKLVEVPILYVPRTVDEGKKIGISHVLPQVVQAIRCRYFRKTIQLSYK